MRSHYTPEETKYTQFPHSHVPNVHNTTSHHVINLHSLQQTEN